MKNKRNIIFVTLLVIFTLSGVFIGRQSKAIDVYENEETNIKKSKNMLSMMLETEAGSGNYEMTTRESWPTSGYKFNSELSKCENGGELSWDDENKRVLMSGNVSDKCYVYFDIKPPLLSEYVKSLYTGTQGENNLYYHDKNFAKGAKDKSYRYAGAGDAVNNYICLGATSPCPDANLFRIIGVFNNQVKVIKVTSLGTMAWDSGDSNTWSTSSLNKYLNGEYLANLGNLATKISVNTWKVGGNTKFESDNSFDKLYDSSPSDVYYYEIEKPVNTNSTDNLVTYDAKIGLIYVSDYGFAAKPSEWKTLYEYNESSLDWLYTGLGEFTITRCASFTNITHIIYSDGRVSDAQVSSVLSVRPSFYLIDSVSYSGGVGTQSDPIIIGD